MRLATWNVNSIRSRADRVAAFLQRSDVDVLALQETKCRDDQFPEMMFNALGYEVAHVGYSQWNVAILSRVGIEDVEIGFPGQPCWAEDTETEARALGATCGGVRVWSSTCRTAARWPTRTAVQARLARRAADDRRRLADRRPGRPGGARRRLEHRPAGRRRVGHERLHPLDARLRARARGVPGDRRGRVRRRRPTARARPGVYTYWDYVRLRFPPPRGHADRLRRSAPPHSPPARPAR